MRPIEAPRLKWIGRPFPPGIQPEPEQGQGGVPGQELGPDGRPRRQRPDPGS